MKYSYNEFRKIFAETTNNLGMGESFESIYILKSFTFDKNAKILTTINLYNALIDAFDRALKKYETEKVAN